MISGAMPIGASACGDQRSGTRTAAAPSAERQPQRLPEQRRRSRRGGRRRRAATPTAAPPAACRSAPSSAATTARCRSSPRPASSVPWWPARTLSTKPIRPVDTWPPTSGAARMAVVRTSSREARGRMRRWKHGHRGTSRATAAAPPIECRALAPGRGGRYLNRGSLTPEAGRSLASRRRSGAATHANEGPGACGSGKPAAPAPELAEDTGSRSRDDAEAIVNQPLPSNQTAARDPRRRRLRELRRAAARASTATPAASR